MSLDAFKNFALGTLSAGIASGATSLAMTAGQGTRFPAVPFNAMLWNSTDFTSPDQDTAVEIVRVTAISTDTFTITRAQEGTADVNHNTGGKTYALCAGVTALTANKLVDKSGDVMTGVLALVGLRVPLTVKTGAYTITSADLVIIHDVTGGAFTLTLPAASAGKQLLYISGITGGGNVCTLSRAGSDTIQSQATNSTTFNLGGNASRAFVSDGVSIWYRIE